MSESKTIILDKEKIKEVKNIARGVFNPLTGFLKAADFQSVVSKMRLESGEVWPIPIVLDISEEDKKGMENEKNILLLNPEKKQIAILENIEFYKNDKDFFAQNVFGTKDKDHPGVTKVYSMGDWLVGGDIKLLDNEKEDFPEYNLTPEETKNIFRDRGWKTIVAFQTRNVPHLGHEFLQKFALRQVDGLLIQPVIGEKKLKDFKDEFIISAYKFLIDKFYPKDKVLLSILPLQMRYAGPREAILHALIRKNFGCTHFIIGRDHAGVGNYYGSYDAQKIFDNFTKEEIGIEILKYENVVYCKSCKTHVFENGCQHPKEDKLSFSGSKLRENLQEPLAHFVRPETYDILLNSINPLVDDMYKTSNNSNKKGFVLWFTGLPQSGKSTLADNVYRILEKEGLRLERLDGDIIRQNLTKDLGFSKEDRDENIRRIGFLSKLLSKNGIGVVAAFISPYKLQREGVRKEVENFTEIFCKCPLEVCEKRDTRGMYAKARRGEIANFTGIDDPYEEPENPEIVIETDKEDIAQCTQKIIASLKKLGYIN